MEIKTSLIIADGNLYAKLDKKKEKIQFSIKAETWRMWHPRNLILIREVALNGRVGTKEVVINEGKLIMKEIKNGNIDVRAIRAPHRMKEQWEHQVK